MILGDTCTRACRFCSVKTARRPEGGSSELPDSPLFDEPTKVATAVAKWEHLKYIVITCVDRDDLMDFGAIHIKKTVQLVKEKTALARNGVPIMVETLLGDFRGDLGLVDIAVTGGMDVFAHNVETVERLNSKVRDRRAGYKQSLAVLEHVAAGNEGR